MRKLMWFTIGYAAACAVCTYLLRGNAVWLLAAGALLAAVFLWKFRRPALIFGGIAVGCVGFMLYSHFVLDPAAAVDGQTVKITLDVTSYSWQTDYGTAVDGTIELEDRDYKVRLYLNESLELGPGDVVETSARLRLTDEGGANEPTFHRTNGILFLGYQRLDDLTVTCGETGWQDLPEIWREKLLEIIDSVFPADTAPFAKALLLGDKTDLSHETNTNFSVCGISHIVAVSGLHVSILFSMIYPLAGKRRYLTAVLGTPCLVLFGALAGFTPSVTRAVIMQILMILALCVNREYDPPTALSFACLSMLVLSPLVIASVGFQLSVASVAGIFLINEKLGEWMTEKFLKKKKQNFRARFLRGIISGVSITLSATLQSTPLVAYYYHTVSLVGVLANLLVVWVVSFIFYGIMATCLGYMIFAPLGSAIGWLVSLMIRYVLAVTDALASIPLAAVYTDSPYVGIWLIFVYLLILWQLLARRNPVISSALAVVSLCVCLLLSYTEPLLCDYRVTVLDVGQGQCILLQSEGYTFMVDCGGDYDQDAGDTAARMLLSMGISRVDGLILTHYDRDHCGGVPYLAERIGIDTLYLPPTADTDGELEQILDVCRDSTQIWLESDMTISFGNASIEIFPPESGDSGNESCNAVLFRGEKCDTLITGDQSALRERLLLAEHDIPDLELLIVGHHGSNNSTCTQLLEATAPDVAIISVGANNSYGHPAQQVLDRLTEAGCVIYRTDLHGTIIYRG